MRQAGFVLVACSIAFVVLLIFFFSPPPTVEVTETTDIAEPVFVTRKPVRDVTPENVVQAPKVTENVLERLPAVEPPPPPPRPEKPDTWTRPIVVAAGIIKSGEKTITLADIKPLDLDKTCSTETSEEWPCGMMARTEMRLFVRGRPLDCTPTDNETKTKIRTRCKLDGFDVSAWLVLTGWAEPLSDEFQSELNEAKANKRGMWRTQAP